MTNIAGIFDKQTDANRALSELLKIGFTQDDISLIVSNRARKMLFTTLTKTTSAARDGVAGALFGSALGAVIASLTAVAGNLTVAGIDLLITGPIVAILSGAGAGAAIGGLAGVLVSGSFTTDEAKFYNNEVRRGKAVVVVNAKGKDAVKAAGLALSSNEATLQVA